MLEEKTGKIAGSDGLIRSYEFVHQEFAEGLHSHASWEMALIYEGRVGGQLGTRMFVFEPGSIVLLPPRFQHSWQSDKAETASGIVFHFGREAVPDLMLRSLEMEKVRRFLSERDSATVMKANDLERVRARMRSVHRSKGVLRVARFWVAMDLAGQQRTVEVINNQSERGLSSKEIARLTKAKQLIEDRYAERVKRSEIAREVGMEESAFSRFFHQASGMKFSDYLSNRRISKAAVLLSSRRDLRVPEVARMSGFRNTSAFNRQFLKRMGTTPRTYRKSADSEPVLP